MKSILRCCLLLSLVCTLIPFFPSSAEELNISAEQIEYFDDGSYCETILFEEPQFMRSATKSGTKTAKIYSKSKKLLWSYTLKGTFTYTGTKATCTKASYTTTIVNKDWKLSPTAGKSGNKAIGKVTGKTPFQTITRNLTITCSNTGKLS